MLPVCNDFHICCICTLYFSDCLVRKKEVVFCILEDEYAEKKKSDGNKKISCDENYVRYNGKCW